MYTLRTVGILLALLAATLITCQKVPTDNASIPFDQERYISINSTAQFVGDPTKVPGYRQSNNPRQETASLKKSLALIPFKEAKVLVLNSNNSHYTYDPFDWTCTSPKNKSIPFAGKNLRKWEDLRDGFMQYEDMKLIYSGSLSKNDSFVEGNILVRGGTNVVVVSFINNSDSISWTSSGEYMIPIPGTEQSHYETEGWYDHNRWRDSLSPFWAPAQYFPTYRQPRTIGNFPYAAFECYYIPLVDTIGLSVEYANATCDSAHCSADTTCSRPAPSLVPIVTSQPQGISIAAGSPATFSINATGDSLRYQWTRNGSTIPAATLGSFTIQTATPIDDSIAFRCIVSNRYGSVTSSPALLRVSQPSGQAPVITSPLLAQSVSDGQTVFFVISATGTSLTYQWQRNGTILNGATGSTYSFTAAVSDDSTTYQCIVSNPQGSISSTLAVLRVTTAQLPAITMQPQDMSIILGQQANFSIAAFGSNLSYQWRRNGVPISSAISPGYVFYPTINDDSTTYSCFVSNPQGNVTSAIALLRVTVDTASPGATFASGPTLNEARTGQYTASSVALGLAGDDILVFGGHTTNFIPSQTIEKISVTSNTSSLSTMNYPHDGGAFAYDVLTSRFFLGGGADALGVAPGSLTAEMYNATQTGSFVITASQMTVGHVNGAAVFIGNNPLTLIVAGGWYNVASAQTIERYSTGTGFRFTNSGTLPGNGRSSPILLPAGNASFIIASGTDPYGGQTFSTYLKYAVSDSAGAQLQTTTSPVIATDTGVTLFGINSYQRDLQEQLFMDNAGSEQYLLLAKRAKQYLLVQYSAATATFSKYQENVMSTQLPSTDSIWIPTAPIVDNVRKKAYLFAINAASMSATQWKVRLYTIDLQANTISAPTGWHIMPANYYLSGCGFSLLRSGQILMTGGYSVLNDPNFTPIALTTVITPQ